MTTQWEQPPAQVGARAGQEPPSPEDAFAPSPYRPADWQPPSDGVTPTGREGREARAGAAPLAPLGPARRRILGASLVAGLALTGVGIAGIVHGATAPHRHVVELVNGGAQVTLEAGDERALYVRDGLAAPQQCAVSGPDGGPVHLEPATFSSSGGGHTTEEIASFAAPRAGTYTVTCTPADEGLRLADAVGAEFGLGIGGTIVGSFLAIGGPVLALTLRRRTVATTSPEPLDV